MTESLVRGAGRPRAGATDTTMLIWKVVAANPGITRQGIWERIEHDIPAGFAMRRFPPKVEAGSSASTLRTARRRLLNETICTMERHGTILSEGGSIDRPFRAARKPNYHGNAEAVDETGTKAAEHMAVAEALRTAEKWAARAKLDRVNRNGRRGPVLGPTYLKEYEAVLLVIKTLRAQGSAGA